MKDVMIVTGTGQISMAIARRVGYGKKIIFGDKNMDNCNAAAKIMNDAGVSSSQAPVEAILKVDLYGTAQG